MLCKECGEAEAIAKGLCGTCYVKKYDPGFWCVSCGKHMAVARGLCRTCYIRAYRTKDLPAHKPPKLTTKEVNTKKLRGITRPILENDDETLLKDETFMERYFNGESDETGK